MEPLSFSDREFKIWDYTVSHRQMVIRSLGPEEGSPNLDLHFRGVEFVRAPTVFRGLTVVPPTEQEIAEAQAMVAPSDVILRRSVSSNRVAIGTSWWPPSSTSARPTTRCCPRP